VSTGPAAPARTPAPGALEAFDPAARVPVNKAYKMYVGGAFVRSESGRYFQSRAQQAKVEGGADPEVVNLPRGSRKDVRDAVLAARNVGEGWAARTAYNRGQILYRLAEVMESRRAELCASLERAGREAEQALREVERAVDRTVYYAGFCDKYQALLASFNPVAGPYFAFSMPGPMGVVAILAPERPALLGLVSTVLPVVVAGNTSVVVAGSEDARTAVVWCECLATSDLPGGVVNVLTGRAGELALHLAAHREVAAVDAWSDDPALRAEVEREGSGSVKRVRTHGPDETRQMGSDAGQGLAFIERFLETKSLWHPVGR
jgi:acyl-CoA reductase-like NAD-dependent aldehyde dehydrogenase